MMSGNIGFGVFINMLSNNDETIETLNTAIGKTISDAYVDDDCYIDGGLIMKFTDETGIMIYDDGRSCCEHRYIHTDDDLSHYSGAMFKGVELKDAPEIEDEYGFHEVQFLIINTDKGSFTLETHNEHNGYYSGFYMKARHIQSS
jgi:hypothetical protein